MKKLIAAISTIAISITTLNGSANAAEGSNPLGKDAFIRMFSSLSSEDIPSKITPIFSSESTEEYFKNTNTKEGWVQHWEKANHNPMSAKDFFQKNITNEDFSVGQIKSDEMISVQFLESAEGGSNGRNYSKTKILETDSPKSIYVDDYFLNINGKDSLPGNHFAKIKYYNHWSSERVVTISWRVEGSKYGSKSKNNSIKIPTAVYVNKKKNIAVVKYSPVNDDKIGSNPTICPSVDATKYLGAYPTNIGKIYFNKDVLFVSNELYGKEHVMEYTAGTSRWCFLKGQYLSTPMDIKNVKYKRVPLYIL